MNSRPRARSEQQRLRALRALDILDTPAEVAFDDLTALAAHICEAPIALITFLDAGRLWFKSRYGFERSEAERGTTLCEHVVEQGEFLVVEDVARDVRFANYSFVVGEPHLRFYAGAPLVSREGVALGTLCVVDTVPRELKPSQREALQVLSRQVIAQLELRHSHAGAQRELLEQQRVHERLVHERNLSDSAFNSVPGIFYLFDDQGRFLRWNRNFEKVTGRSSEEFSSLHPLELFHEDYRELVGERIAETLLTGTSEVEATVLTKDGRTLDYYLTGRRVDVDGRPCVIGMGVDITARKQLEARLRQVQRIESIGQLAAGLAHDFNNILMVIQGHTNLLLANRELPTKALDSLEQIGHAAERAARMTGQLLMLSRKQVMQICAVDVNEVLLRLMPTLERLLGESLQVDLKLGHELPAARADVGMIEQVLLNLIINARDASAPGGRVTIRTELVEVAAQPQSLQHPDSRPGTFVSLSVTDTGVGIAPDQLAHIFEPFYTTKDVGKGTGLGLATVYSIVRQHQGWVEVTSEVGTGTTFRVLLTSTPLAPQALPTSTTTFEPAYRGKETILVVEDEPSVAATVETILQDYGYRTLLATDGPMALDRWAVHRDEVDLVLTDLVMPRGMSGRELAHKLWSERPELKVIYMSGYTAEAVRKDLALHPQLRFLQKPYSPRELARLVRESLGPPAA